MDLIVEEPDIGTLVIASGGDDVQARQVVALREKTDKAMAFVWTAGQSSTAGLGLLKESDIPIYYQPGRAAISIKALLEYHRRREQFLEDVPVGPQPPTEPQERQMEKLHSLGRQNLSEHEAKELLSCWGVPANREIRAETWEQASSAATQIGYPVVLKVDSPDVTHKTEAGLVRLGIAGEAELRAAYDSLIETSKNRIPGADVSGVLVGEMVAGGVEVIVGITRDSQFGPVLLFGIGGIFVELFEDVSRRVCPISRRDAIEMVHEVKGARVLQGYRGQPPSDVDALVDVLMRVSDMAMHLQDQVVELDINPLAVLPRGQGVKALDALAVLDS